MMLGFRKYLQSHPFAVDAHFDDSLVLAFAVEKQLLEPHIPEVLDLDLFQDRWGFIAVAMVRTKCLRPKLLPKFVGRNFILSGYRIFVRYRGRNGRNCRGLCIKRSETDSQFMVASGNVFTKYRYRIVDIDWRRSEEGIHKIQTSGGLRIHANVGDEDMPLPKDSPFSDWREARRFAGPMPFTFSYDEKEHRMTIVEGVRDQWKPKPVHVEHAEVPFLKEVGIENAILANAFLVSNVDYHWKKGVTEPCG